MVEIQVDTYVVLGGIAVVVVLVLFLFLRKSSSQEEETTTNPRYKNKKSKKSARPRNKGGKSNDTDAPSEKKTSHKNNVPNSKKANKKDNKTTEDLSGYTPEEDEVKTILEFIKGKDSEELMRREKITATKPKTERKEPTKEQVVIEEFSDNEESGEEFLIIKKKKPKLKGDKEAAPPVLVTKKGKAEKSFFKNEVREKPERKPRRERSEGERTERRSDNADNADETTDTHVQKRPNSERDSGKDESRKRTRRENSSEQGTEDQDPREPKRYVYEPLPLDNYNPPSVNDIMSSMTSFFETTASMEKPKFQHNNSHPKPKSDVVKPPKERQGPKESREKGPTSNKIVRAPRKGFDALGKKLQISVLQFLDPADLLAFSLAGKNFAKLAKSEPIWKNLCLFDFGIKEKTQEKWKLTYKSHYVKNKK